MTFKNYKIAGVLAASLGMATVAQAGFVTTSTQAPGASTMNIVSTNEFKGALATFGVTQYTLGVSLGVDSYGSVTYYYLGKEAGYQNVFLAGPHLYTTGLTPTLQNYLWSPIEIGSVEVGPGGPLDFGFCAFASPFSAQGCVSNVQNDAYGWSSSQSIAFSTSGDTAWIFWDDSGAGPDDNHDDMLIKAVFTPRSVPEPATLGLFGLGLLGVWAGTRRRAARKAA